ncbi:MAG: HDOD domain-containing protein [Proteobacteria bacterium]|nr:HDOD domain-containing protein [Pseudomonadota bacterium]
MKDSREQDSQGSTAHKIFVARQPIFSRRQKIFGYELFFRSGLDNYFDTSQDACEATSKVITNSYLLIGLRDLTENRKAFINFTAGMLVKDYPSLFPKDITVIEVLADLRETEEVLAACRSLRDRGYLVVLDSFFFRQGEKPLVDHADIVKLDINQMSRPEIVRHFHELSGKGVKLLAECVETVEEFEFCRSLGFDYFQGYFFSRPKIVTGNDIPGTKMKYLQLLQQIQDDNYDYNKISRLVSTDASLSYKLLKYVNSAFFALNRQVDSLNSALAIVGENNLRKWLALMLLSYLSEEKPSELLRLCLFRARFCELIAQRNFYVEANKFYTAGMFSLLDALLDQPMEILLEEIPFSDAVKEALLGGGTSLANTLKLARAYERGDWAKIVPLTYALAFPIDELPKVYDEALSTVRSYEISD